jgi:hypothetical protein
MSTERLFYYGDVGNYVGQFPKKKKKKKDDIAGTT